jgi:hypothetical protein
MGRRDDSTGLGRLSFFQSSKKGLKTICSNYRGISLICTTEKVFAIVLHNRFCIQCNVKTRPNQAGFCPGMGTINQLFVLRQTFGHTAKHQKPNRKNTRGKSRNDCSIQSQSEVNYMFVWRVSPFVCVSIHRFYYSF